MVADADPETFFDCTYRLNFIDDVRDLFIVNERVEWRKDGAVLNVHNDDNLYVLVLIFW